MKELLAFCKAYNISIKIIFDKEFNTYSIIGLCLETNRRYGFRVPIDKIDDISFTPGTIIYENFVNALRPGTGNTIESILERAKASWVIDAFTGTRVVTSYNPEAPLTEEEQNMIIRMWRAQNFYGDIEFKVSDVVGSPGWSTP